MSLLTQVIGSATVILALTAVVCLIIFIVMAFKQRKIWKNIPEGIQEIIKKENEEQKKSLEKRLSKLEKEVEQNEEGIKEEESDEEDFDSDVTSDADSTDEDGEDFLDDGPTEREDLFSGESDETIEYDRIQSGGSSITKSSSGWTGQDEGRDKSSGFTPI